MAENPAEHVEVDEGSFTPMSDLAQVPHVYANGFQIGVSNADINIVLKLDGQPLQVLHVSYTLAKTLQQKVGDVVSRFEKAVNRSMLVTDEVNKAFRELQESEKTTRSR